MLKASVHLLQVLFLKRPPAGFVAFLREPTNNIHRRLQLMCYKYLWDNLIAERFPAENFCSYFWPGPQLLVFG
ncbi:hypothetical protein SETIT_3G046300v2 [Setaria italica]|uniref:Uncharacterized protein n=1 Tax=Setaria italica TaxID=4555 RepID=A0A368QBH4_SETIT|nr:hypothetical protein SETIT_3G046300v2 [Setaria italica]